MIDQQDIKYKNNFLTNVVFQVKFSPILEISEEAPVRFQKNLRKSFFPYYEEMENIVLSAKINKSKKAIQKQETFPVYRFKDKEKDETKVVVLRHDSLAVEFFQYENFVDFEKVVKDVFGFFQGIYSPPVFERIGLRYINQVVLDRGHPLIWNEYINSSLIHAVEYFFKRDQKLSRAMSQIVLNYDDYKINFNYGMFNSEYPAKISRKEFVLDFDCFSEQVEPENIFSQLEIFNSEIKQLFEKSIKSKLREKMEVLNE